MIVADAKVVGHDDAGAGYRLVELECPVIARAAKPGQFINIKVPGASDLVLRRPFSIFRAGDRVFSILYKVIGRGTRAMMAVRKGDRVSVVGPLGNSFELPRRGTHPVLVAGGCGVAPLVMLAGRSKVKGTVFVGGRTCGDVLCTDDFRKLGWKVRAATEDGSLGGKGLVTVPLAEWLRSADSPRNPVIYACGPEGMLRAVAAAAKTVGVPAWVSLERYMGCGIGVCLSCVVTARFSDGTTGRVRVCREGPVFDASEIEWQA